MTAIDYDMTIQEACLFLLSSFLIVLCLVLCLGLFSVLLLFLFLLVFLFLFFLSLFLILLLFRLPLLLFRLPLFSVLLFLLRLLLFISFSIIFSGCSSFFFLFTPPCQPLYFLFILLLLILFSRPSSHRLFLPPSPRFFSLLPLSIPFPPALYVRYITIFLFYHTTNRHFQLIFFIP